MGATLERGAAGAGWAQGRVGNVVFLDHRTRIDSAGVERAFELIADTMARYPKGIAMVASFGERTRVPPAELLKSIADFLNPRSAQILSGCTVIEGDSVSAKVKWAAVAMVTSLVRLPYGHKTLRTAAAACASVAPFAVDESGTSLSQALLFAGVTALKQLVPQESLETSRW